MELELSSSNGGSTLPLFDESPVRDNSSRKLGVQHSVSPSIEVASQLWLNKDEAGALVEELNRVNAENKRLTEMLTVVCENYNELKRKLTDYMSNGATSINNETESSNPVKKRRTENLSNGNNKNSNVESISSDEEDSYGKPKELETVKAKITRVAVRTEASDSSLILRDGYQWRKYGQKVTRDNPCPRAYFKCSFAPTCPVKKKVQRSLEDQSMLVATYEGEHNHPPPVQPEATPGSGVSRSVAPTLGSVPTLGSAVPTVTLDRAKPKPNNITNDTPNPTKMLTNTSTGSEAQAQPMKFNSSEFQKFLAEQMASSLTKDPNFTAALAAAISGRFAQRSSSD